MQCILYKIYFWNVFHMYYKLICILYALLCGQNFIFVKSGCYNIAPNLPQLNDIASKGEYSRVLIKWGKNDM
jgi:hypothetical protein